MNQQVPAASKEENLQKLKSASLFVSTIGILLLLCGGFACAVASGPESVALSTVVLFLGVIYFFLGLMIKHRSLIALYITTGLTLIILLLGLVSLSPVVLLVSVVLLFRLISTLSASDVLQ